MVFDPRMCVVFEQENVKAFGLQGLILNRPDTKEVSGTFSRRS